MVYLITYDLKRPGQNYQPLWDAIRKLGPSIRPLESTWFVDSPSTKSETIYNFLVPHIDNTDRLLVLAARPDFTGWFTNADGEWLRKRLA